MTCSVFSFDRKNSTAATIFEAMSGEDFQHTIVVTKRAKTLAWFIIIVLNLYFVYFSVLRGISRSVSWQRDYVFACIFQLLVEVFLYETCECLWIHYTIPNLVQEEVAVAMNTVKHTIKLAFHEEQDHLVFDTPKYFFVSRQLAEAYPQLFESSVVLAFHNLFPPSNLDMRLTHPSATERQGSVAPMMIEPDVANEIPVRDHNHKNFLLRFIHRFNVSFLVLIVLQYVGTVPIRFQQLIIHTLQPILFSFVLVLYFVILKFPAVGLIVICFLVYEAFVHVNRNRYRDERPVAAINDINRSDQVKKIVETKRNEEMSFTSGDYKRVKSDDSDDSDLSDFFPWDKYVEEFTAHQESWRNGNIETLDEDDDFPPQFLFKKEAEDNVAMKDPKLQHLENKALFILRKLEMAIIDTDFMTLEEIKDDTRRSDYIFFVSNTKTTSNENGKKESIRPWEDRRTRWQRMWDHYRLLECDLIMPHRNSLGHKITRSDIVRSRKEHMSKSSHNTQNDFPLDVVELMKFRIVAEFDLMNYTNFLAAKRKNATSSKRIFVKPKKHVVGKQQQELKSCDVQNKSSGKSFAQETFEKYYNHNLVTKSDETRNESLPTLELDTKI